MAAVYAVPQGARGVPGLVQVHGGGQSANLDAVRANARRGYACISINWLGNPVRGVKEGLPNTDWGAVDATQNGHNDHFLAIEPDDKTIETFVSPRNSNWYLAVMAARRALTFLQRQPEVDGQKLGVYGHSMGGTVTTHVAAVDRRVKAAVATCGGVGFTPSDPLSLKTIADRAHLPLITCPILFCNPTNDFNGFMDDTDRAVDIVQSKDVRITRSVHFNHETTPPHEVCWPLWFDQHLKAAFQFPQTPQTRLLLKQDDGTPVLEVTPDASRKVVSVELYYSRGDDPRVRFWINVDTHKTGNTWTARCPVLDPNQPLRAFANVTYGLDAPVNGAGYYYDP